MSQGALVEPLLFLSTLPESYRADFEQLLFFNPGQLRASEDIQQSIDQFGVPEIAVEDASLCLTVGRLGKVQVLFAVAPRDGDAGPHELAGAIVYHRSSFDEIIILHVAVTERYSSVGERADQMVVPRLVKAVRDAARRLKGVTCVILYVSGIAKQIPIRHG